MQARRRYLAYFFAFLMLLSNIGIGIYRHWCGCRQMSFVSVGQTIDHRHCCQQKQQPVCSKRTDACCAIGSTKTVCVVAHPYKAHSQQPAPYTFAPKCCDTESQFWVGETPLSDLGQPLPQGNDWIAEPILPLPVVYSVLPHTALPIALYIGSVRCDIPPPVPLPLDTGRDRINWIQIYRC